MRRAGGFQPTCALRVVVRGCKEGRGGVADARLEALPQGVTRAQRVDHCSLLLSLHRRTEWRGPTPSFLPSFAALGLHAPQPSVIISRDHQQSPSYAMRKVAGCCSEDATRSRTVAAHPVIEPLLCRFPLTVSCFAVHSASSLHCASCVPSRSAGRRPALLWRPGIGSRWRLEAVPRQRRSDDGGMSPVRL